MLMGEVLSIVIEISDFELLNITGSFFFFAGMLSFFLSVFMISKSLLGSIKDFEEESIDISTESFPEVSGMFASGAV